MPFIGEAAPSGPALMSTGRNQLSLVLIGCPVSSVLNDDPIAVRSPITTRPCIGSTPRTLTSYFPGNPPPSSTMKLCVKRRTLVSGTNRTSPTAYGMLHHPCVVTPTQT